MQTVYIQKLNQFDVGFPLVEKKTHRFQSNGFLFEKKKKIKIHPETIESGPEPCAFIYAQGLKFKFLNIP